MPTLSANEALLRKLLEAEFTAAGIVVDGRLDIEAWRQVLERFGADLDDVAQDENGATIHKIDLPANRYDLLSTEGMAVAMRSFIGGHPPPKYTFVDSEYVMTVHSSVNDVRPYVLCAVLKGVNLTADSYKSFIAMQDKMHGNLCNKRSLVSIGTHDLAKITPPFTYSAEKRENIKFIPLNKKEPVTGEAFFDEFRKEKHLSKYLHIIEGSPVLPLVKDATGEILSLPPIINGEYSKMEETTKDVFIEVTCKDKYKGNIVMNQLLSNFGIYTNFEVHRVKVVYEHDGTAEVNPALEHKHVSSSLKDVRRVLGVDINKDDIPGHLHKMMIIASVTADGAIDCVVPPNRSDVLHSCDIVEDVGISYGYNKIAEVDVEVPVNSIGWEHPVSKLQHQVRLEFAAAGYNEVLNMGLCSRDDCFDKLRQPFCEDLAVTILNPQTLDFQICRTTLLPGLLKCLFNTQGRHPLPIKLFEVSDIVVRDAQSETGCTNRVVASAVFESRTSNIDAIQNVTNLILLKLGVQDHVYEEADSHIYLPLRGVRAVSAKYGPVGTFGILHPEVLAAFGVKFPTVYCEIEIEKFL